MLSCFWRFSDQSWSCDMYSCTVTALGFTSQTSSALIQPVNSSDRLTLYIHMSDFRVDWFQRKAPSGSVHICKIVCKAFVRTETCRP